MQHRLNNGHKRMLFEAGFKLPFLMVRSEKVAELEAFYAAWDVTNITSEGVDPNLKNSIMEEKGL